MDDDREENNEDNNMDDCEEHEPCKGGKPYYAMVLSCIDPRIVPKVQCYMDVTNKQRCRYSQFVIAGAAVGVVAKAFKHWHETFWENLRESIHLHEIGKVIAIDHRDCGAARAAYGDAIIDDPVEERLKHMEVLADFRKQVKDRSGFLHKELEVVTGLMELDGTIELFS